MYMYVDIDINIHISPALFYRFLKLNLKLIIPQIILLN